MNDFQRVLSIVLVLILSLLLLNIIICFNECSAEGTTVMKIPSVKLYSCLTTIDLDYEKTNSVQDLIDDNWKGVMKRVGKFSYFIADHSSQGYDKLYDVQLDDIIYVGSKTYIVNEIGYGSSYVGGTLYRDVDIEHEEYSDHTIVLMTCTGIEHQRLIIIAKEKLK